jgi:hypothetical protein
MDTDDDKVAPVCVFSFAFPRIGNVSFRLRFERELGGAGATCPGDGHGPQRWKMELTCRPHMLVSHVNHCLDLSRPVWIYFNIRTEFKDLNNRFESLGTEMTK